MTAWKCPSGSDHEWPADVVRLLAGTDGDARIRPAWRPQLIHVREVIVRAAGKTRTEQRAFEHSWSVRSSTILHARIGVARYRNTIDAKSRSNGL